MVRSSFLWKLYAGYAALILIATTLVGIPVGRRLEADARQEMERTLVHKASLLQAIALPRLAREEFEGFQSQVRDLGRKTETRFTVIGSDGKVIADSSEDPARMDNHGTRPEVLEAMQHGVGRASRFSDTLRREMIYLAMEVRSPEGVLGYVRVALPRSDFYGRVGVLRWSVALAAAVASAFALVVGFLLARRLTAPLRRMTAVADSLASGDYDARVVHVRGRDEIGRLATALNTMAQELRSRIETVTSDRSQLLAIIGGMVEGVVAVDEDEKILHMNRAAGTLLQADPASSMGRRIWEVSRLRDVSEVIDQTLRGGGEVKREVRLAGSGPDRILRVHASPLKAGTGRISGGVVVLHDVTELRRLERVRSDFIANVSHELKTPLTAICGLIETILEDGEMEDVTRQRFTEKIRDQGRRLSALVADLLTLSRLESNGLESEFRSLDLRDPIRHSLDACSGMAEEKGLDLEVDIPTEPIRVRGDAEGLRQVVDNLVGNAIQYTPQGGRILVRVRQGEREAILEVEDSGIGIEAQDQKRIFERFYRVDKARSLQVGGTGLGLSIVKHIAAAHRGSASVESVPGKGSTFRVRLPLELS